MPVPTSYTEAEYIDFLHGLVSTARLATLLNWEPLTDGSAYADIVVDVLLAFAKTTVDELTDISQLRAVGRVLLWRKVLEGLTLVYDYSTDAGSYSRNQIHAHVATLLANAEREASRIGGVAGEIAVSMPEATITEMSRPDDPYAPGSQAQYRQRYRLRPPTG